MERGEGGGGGGGGEERQREGGGGGETLSLSHHHVHQRDHTTLSIPRRSNTFVVIAQQQYKDTGYK